MAVDKLLKWEGREGVSVGEADGVIERSIDEIVDESIDHVFDQGVDHSIDKSIDRSIDRSIDESIDKSFDESIDRSIDKSIDKSFDRSIDHSIDRSIDHSLNKVINKPIDHSPNKPIDHSPNKPNDHSPNKPNDPSPNKPNDPSPTKPTNPSTHPSKNTPNSHSLAPTASLLFHLLSPLLSLIPSNQLPPNPDQLLWRLFERQFLRALLRFLDVDRSRQLQLSRQLANDTFSLQSFWNPREHCFQYNDTESLRCVRNQTAVLPMLFGLEGVLNAEIDDFLGLLLDHRQVSEIGAIYGS